MVMVNFALMCSRRRYEVTRCGYWVALRRRKLLKPSQNAFGVGLRGVTAL